MKPVDYSTLADPTCKHWRVPHYMFALTAALVLGGNLHAQTIPAGHVCFYEHIDYAGASVCVNASMNLVPAGWNEQASSMRMAPGLRLEMFEHMDFNGTRLILTGNTPNFVALDFNDRLSSFRINATGGSIPPSPAPTPAPALTFTSGGIPFNSNPCATENGRCTFTGSQNIAYGAQGTFVVKTLTGGTDCNNSVFGDPINGVYKSCYLQSAPAPTPVPVPVPTFSTGGISFDSNSCATENNRCTFTGSRSVAYGAQGTFSIKTLTGGADCNNGVFGDPIYGVLKACYLQSGTAPAPSPAPAPAPTPVPAPAPAALKIQLPIEVLGAQGTTSDITFKLDRAGDAAAATSLWLQTHNVRYADKASVKINNGVWVNLNNATVQMTGTSGVNRLNKTVAAGDAYKGPVTDGYGGIGGVLAVLKMKLPIAANTLKQGDNTITFRFNTSNGVSMGYRVIDINLLDAAGNKILPQTAFEESAPASWAPPKTAQADIDKGKDLWMTAQLKTSYLPGAATIIAKCTDCHTATGRDLKYFGYSNKSIVERAKFHGLSTLEGEQIASYIRTLPVKAIGRPWNPPYQPGPGLTSRPNDAWAAGAGINNVLDSDWNTIKAIFPNGVKRDALMEGDSNKFKRFATHDTPLAFQLPDWNHWLPEVHPYDAFGKANADSTENFKMYKEIRQSLQGKSPAQIKDWFSNSFPRQGGVNAAAPKGYFAFTDFGKHFPSEINDRGWAGQFNANNRVPKADTETAKKVYSAQLWKMVKHVELHEEFGLTGMGPEATNVAWAGFNSKHALPRMWVGAERVVFDISPFLSSLEEGVTGSASGNNDFNYDYLSNSWYQLQLILNAGQRTTGGHRAVDFGYAFGFLQSFDRFTNFSQAGRNTVWALIAMDESDMDNGPNNQNGWSLRRTDIGNPLGFNNDYAWSKVWLTQPTAEARQVRNLLQQVQLEKSATWLPIQYAFKDINGNLSETGDAANRRDGIDDGANFMRPVYVLTGVNREGRNQTEGTHSALTEYKARNFFPAALQNGWASWAQAVWPGLNNANVAKWEAVKVATQGTVPAQPGLSNGAAAGAVNVSWQAVPGATSYNVKRSDSANGPFMTVAYFRTGASYADTVPVAGRTYYYRVSSNSSMDTTESADSASQSISR